MAQGKAFTAEERERIIQSLQVYLEAGLSRNKACEYIGLPPQTLSNWVVNDESLGIKLQGWENATNILAVRNIMDAIAKEAELEDTKKETSKWWVERRMKNEFSTRTENTGADGKDLIQPVITPDEKTKLLSLLDDKAST
jgi:transposase-like protein